MTNQAFHDYWWFKDHPALQYDDHTQPWIEIEPHLVDPLTRDIEPDTERNTHLEWWIECGPWWDDEYHGVGKRHDWELDCGGDTIEGALSELRVLVTEKYGDY
jgi:hypothetical protein